MKANRTLDRAVDSLATVDAAAAVSFLAYKTVSRFCNADSRLFGNFAAKLALQQE